jgi:hypothetical protein
MRSRSKSENHNPCRRISEPGNRLGPIIVLEIRAPLFPSNPLAIFDEPWTSDAGNYLLIEDR